MAKRLRFEQHDVDLFGVVELVARGEARARRRRDSCFDSAETFGFEQAVGVLPNDVSFVSEHLVRDGASVLLTVYDPPKVGSLHCKQAQLNLIARTGVVTLVHETMDVGKFCIVHSQAPCQRIHVKYK